ncbi:uncharacterized protein NEMAJ01_2136 [Nematocida major]|uniref:uncharacterized protein n=1 Tax=Nematocida major TaxID=1912982 RepID=UPI002008EA15|nr:uncharacterized protein NEMAJ01_2136 [Nematocida major]KAH9387240.1 hypothetical protein NEMAJ01_2136 [Nematocida major]
MRLLFSFLCVLLAAGQMAVCICMSYNEMLACLSRPVGRVRGEDVYVCPGWVGHPVCVAKLGWLGYVYNMRAYSCGLATSFSLVPRKENGKEVHTYTREPEKDRARLPDSIASAAAFAGDEGYSMQFHRALVHMFELQKDGESTYDRLAVETGRPCSFTEFLRESCRTQKEAHCVLAALVLLSEGVDVSIETSGNRVILKKRKDSNDVLVDAYISVPAMDSGEIQPSEAWQVVNFFKRYRGTHMLPSTYEEFEKGNFLESPQLLILTYVGEYVRNAEELMSVMECAFKLVKGMGLVESLEDANSVVSRMFMCAEQLSKAEAYLCPFLGAQKKMEKARVFGELVHVQKHLNVLRYKRVANEFNWGDPSINSFPESEICPEYSGLKEADNSDDSDMLQSTISGPANLESCAKFEDPAGALCLLLLCLAYNPKKMEYNLQGLLERIKQAEVSAEVRAAILALQAYAEERTFFGTFNSCNWAGRYGGCGPDIIERLKQILEAKEWSILGLMREFATKTGQPQAVIDGFVLPSWSLSEARDNISDAEALKRINSVVRPLAAHKQVKIKGVHYLDKSNCNRYAVIVKHPHEDKRCRQAFKVAFSDGYIMSYVQLPDPFLSSDVLKEMRCLAALYRQDALFSSFVFAECVDRMVLMCNQRWGHSLGVVC